MAWSLRNVHSERMERCILFSRLFVQHQPDGTRHIAHLHHGTLIKLGTVSLPASGWYIGLDLPALCRDWFSLTLFISIDYWVIRISNPVLPKFILLWSVVQLFPKFHVRIIT